MGISILHPILPHILPIANPLTMVPITCYFSQICRMRTGDWSCACTYTTTGMGVNSNKPIATHTHASSVAEKGAF